MMLLLTISATLLGLSQAIPNYQATECRFVNPTVAQDCSLITTPNLCCEPVGESCQEVNCPPDPTFGPTGPPTIATTSMASPTTSPTTANPTTSNPTTSNPTTSIPTTAIPTASPTTASPTTTTDYSTTTTIPPKCYCPAPAPISTTPPTSPTSLKQKSKGYKSKSSSSSGSKTKSKSSSGDCVCDPSDGLAEIRFIYTGTQRNVQLSVLSDGNFESVVCEFDGVNPNDELVCDIRAEAAFERFLQETTIQIRNGIDYLCVGRYDTSCDSSFDIGTTPPHIDGYDLCMDVHVSGWKDGNGMDCDDGQAECPCDVYTDDVYTETRRSTEFIPDFSNDAESNAKRMDGPDNAINASTGRMDGPYIKNVYWTLMVIVYCVLIV